MAKIRGNLKQIQAHVKRNLHSIAKESMELERELAEIMSAVVIQRVYEAYTPQTQEVLDMRREDTGLGLSDTRNMIVSDVRIESSGIRVIFENIAEGRDTMSSDGMLVDAFENPSGSGNWSSQGEWSEGRSFISETAERIRQNPEPVLEAIRLGLKQKGFTVK